MRTARSFDPCLPCGVHLFLSDGKAIQVQRSPTFGRASSGRGALQGIQEKKLPQSRKDAKEECKEVRSC
jgi:hypothetical protein